MEEKNVEVVEKKENTALKNFRALTLRKMIVMILATTLPLTAALLLQFKQEDWGLAGAPMPELDFLKWILCAALEAYIIFKIVRYAVVLLNDDYGQKRMIYKNDERINFIKAKSYSLTVKLVFYIMGIGLIVTAFISREIFYTVLALYLLITIATFVIRFVFKRKY